MSNYIPSKEDREKRKKFGKILAQERERYGLTQNQLGEKMGYGMQTISNWETGLYFPKKVEDIIKLADILHCDVDHLLGRMTERTHDNKSACELTGLSEAAIEKIRNPELNHPYAKTLSRMIESERFENLITTYKIFLEFLSKLKSSDLDDQLPWYELNNDNVVLGINQSISHFKQEVSLAMVHLCDDNYFLQASTALQDVEVPFSASVEPGRITIHKEKE